MNMIANIKKHLRLAAIVLLAVLSFGLQQVAAFTVDDFACANQGDFGGTCFFEPCASSTATTGTGTPPSGGSASGETTGPPNAVRKVVWDGLINGGLDPLHAAAVMGNIAHEGGFIPENDSENPNAANPTSKNPSDANPYGYGLIGWTPGSDLSVSSSLTYQMKELGMLSVDKNGNIQYSANYPPYTAETQVAVILAQIHGKTTAYAPSVGQAFLATKTIEDATSTYLGPGGFENPLNPDATRQQRINSAKIFQQAYGGTATAGGDSGTGTGISSGTGGGSSGPAGCCPSSSSGPVDTNVNDVYMLGDSITERATSAYKQALQQTGAKVDIDASVSRGINTPGTDGNKLSGLQAINSDKSEIQQADTVVVALGTNGGATTQDIDNVISAIQAINPSASIFWVNTISVGRSDNFNQNIVGPTNQALNQEAQPQGYQIINWFKAVDPSGSPASPTKSEQDPNKYIDNSDGLGVHPTDAGNQALARLVVSSVGADQNSSSAASQSSQCCSTSTVSFGAGTLPSSVPAPYNSIFTAAANKSSVPPAFLAALFYAGEHGSSWPDPPPPYGHGSPWASSGVASPGGSDWPTQPPGPGAAGPFQFEYPTWQSNAVDGNGDGKKDVEDLTDAAFSGAHLLAGLGANTTDQSKLHDAAYHYNGSGPAAESYADNVMAAYSKFGGASSGGGGGGGGGDSVSGGGASTGCASGTVSPDGTVQAAVQAAQLLSSYKVGYVWGGSHGAGLINTTDPAKLRQQGLDCSSSTSWVLHQAGMYGGTATDSTGFESWGQAGQGAEMTVWANSAHVFIEFNVPGLGHYQLNTIAPGSTPSTTPNATGVGPRFYKWGSPNPGTSGYTPRHWPGT